MALDSSIAILADRHTAVPVPRTPGTWEYEKGPESVHFRYGQLQRARSRCYRVRFQRFRCRRKADDSGCSLRYVSCPIRVSRGLRLTPRQISQIENAVGFASVRWWRQALMHHKPTQVRTSHNEHVPLCFGSIFNIRGFPIFGDDTSAWDSANTRAQFDIKTHKHTHEALVRPSTNARSRNSPHSRFT